jgi:tricorn protease
MLTLSFRKLTLTTALALTLLAIPCLAADPVLGDPDSQDMRLLRSPDIHGNVVAFSYGGDLWTVSADGGIATRLTAATGYLSSPKFSPDGETIAFSGNYDGDHDVYTVAATGGEPVRMTWHPGFDQVIDWQPDGRSVRFLTRRASHTGRDLQNFTVSIGGGLPEQLILPTCGRSSYSPDGKKIAFNRNSRENRTWKRYKGGMAQNIWVYDFAKNDTEKVTEWIGSDNFPMWHGETIYYNSDETGRLQIWAYNTATKQRHQVTFHDEYDVKQPSLGTDAIVYENGGWLYVLDLASEKTRKLQVSLFSDNVLTRPVIKSVGDMIRGGDIAPDAQRAVFGARGDIFTVPAEKGNIRNLTGTPGVHDRDPVWSPDGKQVAYLSDTTGEFEVWLAAADGKGEPKQLTKGSKTYKMGLSWSPNSEHLLMHDAALNLWLVDAESGKMKKIDQAAGEEITNYSWSPHSGWVTYAKDEENGFFSVFLFNLDNGKKHRVTSNFTSDTHPCFDDEGNYLFFASGRNFNPTLGGFDLKPIWANQDGLYLVTLRDDVENPFPFESDEVAVEDEDEEDGDKDNGDKDDGDKKDDDEDKDEEEKEEPIKIDLDGISERLVALDVAPGNYSNLQFTGGKLFYNSRPFAAGGGRGNQRAATSIKLFDMEEREEKDVLGEVGGFALSADGKKLFYASNGSFGIVDADADQKPAEKPLRTGEIETKVDPRAEWRQMFTEAWRLERDFFYDPGMHGVDWDHMYERYGQLVPYVAHGADFAYVLGELIGELNSSHSYVRAGDLPDEKRVGTGLLGCDFALNAKSGRYSFARILNDRDWNGGTETPLFQPGVDVKAGEFLLAVDGVELKAPTNPFSLLENKVGKLVVLTVAAKSDGKDSREVEVTPIARENNLRYEAWVQDNRRKVDKLSDGKIGYLHMPNTAVGGQQGFAKGYYPNLRKEGLIIDERFNGGGFIPDFFMNILRQKMVNLWKPRYGQDWRTPGTAFVGKMAMIANGYAGSGGDALPYYFQYYELGEVIGTRTWGGLVGISRGIGLMGGGGVTFPEFGLFNVNGQWDVENRGVEPTIEIDNLPHELIAGRDPQLEKAVEVLLKQIKEDPLKVAPAPPFPRDKN